MIEEKQRVVIGGIPLYIELEKLDKKYGVPKQGDIIPYKDIEKTLGLKKRTNRFRSAVDKWRKMLLVDHNLVSEADRGKSIVFLQNNERVDHIGRAMNNSFRSVKRAHVKAVRTDKDELSAAKKRELEHQVHLSATILTITKTMVDKNKKRLEE